MVVWRYPDGHWPNVMALLYILAMYVCGWLLLFIDSIGLNIVGSVVLAHSMVIAAYMIHECAHNTIFLRPQLNARLGNALMWVTGACYGKYEDIRHKHFRHHMDKADVVSFDYRPRLAQYPLLVKIMKALEWAYIPAVEIMMHLLVIILPFIKENRRQHRKHVLTVLAVRSSVFLLLAWFKPIVILFYVIAYFLFMTVMRFMDVHQHTYEVFETLDQSRSKEAEQFDSDYEYRNTFSNIISIQHPVLNLLVLNFGYHNAHHVKPTTPWYRLPALHTSLYGDNREQILPFINLLKSYHRYRVPRMLNADEADQSTLEKGLAFIGVDGVSFLTAH